MMKRIYLIKILLQELKHLQGMGSKIMENRMNSLLPIFKFKLKIEKLKVEGLVEI